jgi:hypothetical protein
MVHNLSEDQKAPASRPGPFLSLASFLSPTALLLVYPQIFYTVLDT